MARALTLLLALAGLRLGLGLAQPPAQAQWQSGSIAQLGFGSVSRAAHRAELELL